MLRPERMSRVSVTGSKRVMEAVIETAHDLRLVHLSDYGDGWEGFRPGDPIEGADEAAQKLVTVRALESTLEVTDEDAGPGQQLVTEDALEEQLEEIRQEVNELDDRRSELRDELRGVEDDIDRMEPFVRLGIDLDLLSGYDSVSVAVGEGDADSVRAALEDSDVGSFEVFENEGVVAAVARTEAGTLQDALVNADFTSVEVPEATGDPEEYLSDRRHRKQQLESKLDTAEEDMGDLRLDYGGFLLAAEEQLTIEVDKLEAPLSFATTANAFVAEGWIPTERYDELESALTEAVGDHVEVTELERASYDRHHEEVTEDEDDEAAGETTAGATATGATAGSATDAPADGADEAEETAVDDESAEEEVVADGGHAADAGHGDEIGVAGNTVTMGGHEPPVVQDNPSTIRPFELLTNAVGRPNYSEFDPTIVLFLTFPLMFGFMIGDVGYGLIYAGIGYYIYQRFDNQAWQRLGIVALAAGVMTTIFGVLYGEIFGLHTVSTVFWEGVVGLDSAPIHKGLQPGYGQSALAWFVVTAVFGVLHMNLAYVFEFVENYSLHGLVEAIEETGSWLLALNGLWLFILTRPPMVTDGGETAFAGPKPGFIYQVFDTGSAAAFDLGFGGIPGLFLVPTPFVPTAASMPVMELIGIAMVLLGIVLLIVGPAHEIVEIHVTLAHALSYLRIAAVLLAKAGMAFAVNLLVFGAYVDGDGYYHFMTPWADHGAEYAAEHGYEVMFGGMVNGGAAMLVAGILVLLIGHLVVLVLGVTSAGIQSIRLEYFEFFSKFYEGGGTPYEPFGQERERTAES